MKTKFFSIFLAILILQNACTVKIPLSSNTKKVHNEAQYVQPYYSVKKKKMTNAGLLLPIVGIGLGYYLFNTTKDAAGNALAPEIISKNKASASYLAIGGIGLGLISILINKPTITEKRVSSNDFNSWLNKYNRKTNKNYKLLNNDAYSYLIIPKNNINAFETEEDRLDNIAYLRVINGEIGAFNYYVNNRPKTSKRYNEVLKLREECEYYYRAMNTQLSEVYTFNNMLANCETYMKLYPQFKGNEVFFKNVFKQYNDILLTPVEWREKKVKEIRDLADKIRQRQKEEIDGRNQFLMNLLVRFLEPSNSNSSKSDSNNQYEPKQCGNCFGSGYVSEYESMSSMQMVRVKCSVCGGSGRH